MERFETDLTHCDGCQGDAWKQNPQPPRKRCAMLGPDGAYTLALCADCYEPYAEQERERDEWLSAYSDFYKDLHGFRPRHDWMRTADAARFQAEFEKVAAELKAEMERERAEAEAHRVEVDFQEPADADEYPTCGEGWAYTPAAG